MKQSEVRRQGFLWSQYWVLTVLLDVSTNLAGRWVKAKRSIQALVLVVERKRVSRNPGYTQTLYLYTDRGDCTVDVLYTSSNVISLIVLNTKLRQLWTFRRLFTMSSWIRMIFTSIVCNLTSWSIDTASWHTGKNTYFMHEQTSYEFYMCYFCISMWIKHSVNFPKLYRKISSCHAII